MEKSKYAAVALELGYKDSGNPKYYGYSNHLELDICDGKIMVECDTDTAYIWSGLGDEGSYAMAVKIHSAHHFEDLIKIIDLKYGGY